MGANILGDIIWASRRTVRTISSVRPFACKQGSERETERPSFARNPRGQSGSADDADRAHRHCNAEDLKQDRGIEIDQGSHASQSEKEGHQERDRHNLQPIKNGLVQMGGYDRADDESSNNVVESQEFGREPGQDRRAADHDRSLGRHRLIPVIDPGRHHSGEHRAHELNHQEEIDRSQRQKPNGGQALTLARMTRGSGGQKDSKQHPQSNVVDARHTEGDMADATAEQAHFSQDRSQDGERLHADAYAHRRGKDGRTHAGKKFEREARQDPVSGKATEHHRAGDGRNSYGPERSLSAAEHGGIQVQAGDQTENQHRHRGESREGR